VEEYLIPTESYHLITNITEQDIVNHGFNIQRDDIIVDINSMNYAMKEKNPVDNVHFYTRWEGSSIINSFF
jgi:hypothetical protein